MTNLEAARIMMEGSGGGEDYHTVSQVLTARDLYEMDTDYPLSKVKIDVDTVVNTGDLYSYLKTVNPYGHNGFSFGRYWYGFFWIVKDGYHIKPVYTYSGGIVNIGGVDTYKGAFSQNTHRFNLYIAIHYRGVGGIQYSNPAFIIHVPGVPSYNSVTYYNSYNSFVGSRYIGGLPSSENSYQFSYLAARNPYITHTAGTPDLTFNLQAGVTYSVTSYSYYEDPSQDTSSTTSYGTYTQNITLTNPWNNYNTVWKGVDEETYARLKKKMAVDIKLNQPT